MNKNVRVIGYVSHALLGGRTRYCIIRQVDGRTEASGFLTDSEAIEWAEEAGWTVINKYETEEV